MSVDIIGIRMTRKGYVISAFVMGLPPQWLRCTLERAIYTGFVFEKPFFPDVTLWPRCVMKSDESNSDSLNEFVYGFCGDCFSFLNKFTCVSEKSEHDYSMNIELLPSGIHQNAFPVLQWTSTVHCTQYNLYMYSSKSGLLPEWSGTRYCSTSRILNSGGGVCDSENDIRNRTKRQSGSLNGDGRHIFTT